jgi:hypothetical protein
MSTRNMSFAAAVQRGSAGEERTVISSALIFYNDPNTTLLLRVIILFIFCSQYTALHAVASVGHLETCRLLLQCNADVQAQTEK